MPNKPDLTAFLMYKKKTQTNKTKLNVKKIATNQPKKPHST